MHTNRHECQWIQICVYSCVFVVHTLLPAIAIIARGIGGSLALPFPMFDLCYSGQQFTLVLLSSLPDSLYIWTFPIRRGSGLKRH